MVGAARQTWLIKSEPDVFSIDDLAREGRAPWDGVRNYQARNNMRAMKVGDLVLFYHSSTKVPAVVGVARVCREAYPDHTAWDPNSPYHDPKSTPDRPRWDMVDVEFVEKLPREVTLAEMREDPKLEGMVLLQRSRLSVQPVSRAHFEHILRRGKARTRLGR